MKHSEAKRHQARRLRREHGLSRTAIAAALGVPRSTAGDWVLGMETERTCRLCGETFTAGYQGGPRLYCCGNHQRKWQRVFGGRAVA